MKKASKKYLIKSILIFFLNDIPFSICIFLFCTKQSDKALYVPQINAMISNITYGYKDFELSRFSKIPKITEAKPKHTILAIVIYLKRFPIKIPVIGDGINSFIQIVQAPPDIAPIILAKNNILINIGIR